MMERKVKVGLIQHSCGADRQENVDKAIALIRQAAEQGAQVICTQELFDAMYFPQVIDVEKYNWAEPLDGPTWTTIRDLSRELGVTLICSLYEYAAAGMYFNTVAVYEDGQYLGKYRKHHIPEGPQYLEKYYFTPGDTGYPVFKTKHGTIAVLICWDEWFPEPSRIVALKGAEIVFYPSAIGSEPDHPDLDTSQSWMDAIKAHGIHNGMFIAAVNRVGREDATDGSGHMTFYGRSFLSNPLGQILIESKTNEDEVLVQEIDLNEIKRTRDILQFHRDRRPDSYSEILKVSL
ncbi:carbon-nitrogen hydrolase [Brevibacillus reuszeri]|uniref:carbon-nitrogen hydrolase n=1 Tax=Brevibacillus reuszeri TaxID=54915 RepID=UPI001F312AAF|nr:carbon-nitrogen hydrolase [Brevibacillus reuszeri]